MIFIFILSVLLLSVVYSNANQDFSQTLKGELFNVDNIEAVYQLPFTKAKGVIFLAHGCGHSATDWWPKTTSCPDCIGLPVERKIVKAGLTNGYVMLAVSSRDRMNKCWSVDDIARAVAIIKEFYSKRLPGANKLPLFLLGASSGGNFVAHLAQNRYLHPPVSALAVQISPIHTTRAHHIAPVLFMTMKKDQRMNHAIERIRREIDNSELIVVDETPITPSYFFDQSDGYITMEESIKIQEALLKAGHINAGDLKLNRDPRESEWRNVCTTLFIYSYLI